MTDDAANPNRSRNTIGVALAALLTVAIIVIVFWKSHPTSEAFRDQEPPVMDVDDMPADIEEVNGIWRAYAGPVVMLGRGRPATEFEFGMRAFMMLDEDSRFYIRAQRILLNDPNAAPEVKVSDEQLKQLDAIAPPQLVSEEADRESAITAFKAWESADESKKPVAKTAVLDALRNLARKGIDPTKQAWLDAAGSIKKILTLEQMAKVAVYAERTGSTGFGWGGGGGGRGTGGMGGGWRGGGGGGGGGGGWGGRGWGGGDRGGDRVGDRSRYPATTQAN